jgi:tRNA nucleotidyltransferase/poly(A) polymerase
VSEGLRAAPEEAARFVTRTLREAGHQALFAGGCVRDQLLGRVPNDYDVATSAVPDAVHALFRKTLGVGEQFGIVIVRWRGEQIEVATFRADGDYSDGRRPDSVDYTTDPAVDAQRRDFSVNGLFYDPHTSEVLDFVGGVEDLVAGRVRAIGEARQRFDEDQLRILRAPRFAAVLGFEIEATTAKAAALQADELRTSGVSPERIHIELAKLLRCAGRARGWRWCRALELVPVVLGAIAPHAAQAGRALSALPPRQLSQDELPVAWAALLHAIPPSEADAVLRGLRCSNKERETAVGLLVALAEAAAFPQLSVSQQKRLLRSVEAEHLAALLRATSLADEGDLSAYRQLQARREAFAAEPPPWGWLSKPLLNGADLRAAGLPPGRLYGRVLPLVEDAQLEGRVGDREQALALATSLWAEFS